MKSTAFILWLALAGLSVFAQSPAEELETRFREATKGDLPGVAVLVAREGKILFQGGFGYADVAKKTPITVETKFRIGSVTKQFTAAAILKLVDDGKMTVDDSLAKYFPDFPGSQKITIRQMLTHTSGLKSYTEKPGFFTEVTQPITPAALIASFQNDPPEFAPGTGFRYCNSGYFLLGEIVAKVSGQSFAGYLRTAFFEPLGMKDTGIFDNAHPPAGIALGYAFEKGKASLALDWDMSWAGGAGAMYSTVGDLLRWNEALHGGRVLKPDTYQAMTTPHPLPPGASGMNYGFGVVMSEVAHLPSISHSGGLQGWSSDLMWLPEQKVTLVALSNALPPVRTLAPANITRQLPIRFLPGDIAHVRPPVEDKTIDPKTYPAYAGRYEYPDGIMHVTVEKDHLYARLTKQPRFEIFPRAADDFFWKVTDAQVRFVRDENGRVIAARHTQNGSTFTASRLPEEAVKLTPAQLDACTGQYQYGPLAVLTVKRDGQQLLAQLTGQPEFPIFPTAEGAFEWRVVPAQVRFVKGEDGKVTKATHTQNGITFDAPKIK